MGAKELSIISFLRDNYDCKYSIYHIKEILNSPLKYQKPQIEVISLLNAQYLEQVVDNTTNEPTDYFNGINTCPNDVLKHVKLDFFSRINDLLHASTVDMTHHYHGGQPDLTPKEQASKKFGDFLDLTAKLENEIETTLGELKENDLYELEAANCMNVEQLKKSISRHFADLQFEFLRVITESSKSFDEKPSGQFSNQVGEFRKQIDFTRLQLSQIQPPNIVESIAKRMHENNIYSDQTCEDIFGISRNFRHPDKPLLLWEKVYMVYMVYMQLNSIGYNKDENLKEESKVSAHLYDAQHLLPASVCSVLCTRDKKFRMKAIATYEYLAINTEVLSLSDLLEGVDLLGA